MRPADTWQDIAGLQGAKQASNHAHAEFVRMGAASHHWTP